MRHLAAGDRASARRSTRADWALERVGLAGRDAVARRARSRTATSASSSSRCCSPADPRVLLLDEPMAGVSIEDVPELVELIRSVHVERGQDRADGRAPHGGRDGLAAADRRHAPRPPARRATRPTAIMRNETVQQAYLGEAAVSRARSVSDLHVHLGESHILQGDLLRRSRGRRHRAARPQRRRQDDDPARADRARRPPRHDRARRRRRSRSDADAQDRAARRRLRPGGPRRLRRPDRRREPAPRRARRASRATTSSTTSSPSCRARASSWRARSRAASSRWSRSPARC